jgi:hypothetical protein
LNTLSAASLLSVSPLTIETTSPSSPTRQISQSPRSHSVTSHLTTIPEHALVSDDVPAVIRIPRPDLTSEPEVRDRFSPFDKDDVDAINLPALSEEEVDALTDEQIKSMFEEAPLKFITISDYISQKQKAPAKPAP